MRQPALTDTHQAIVERNARAAIQTAIRATSSVKATIDVVDLTLAACVHTTLLTTASCGEVAMAAVVVTIVGCITIVISLLTVSTAACPVDVHGVVTVLYALFISLAESDLVLHENGFCGELVP